MDLLMPFGYLVEPFGYLFEPFGYGYMRNAMWVSALVGGVCAFLSCYLMLKGWSLIGDALSHSIVPGVAGAYMLGLPFSLGAFFAGGLASAAMLFLNQRSKLKEDVIIGLIFSSFFGLGLFMVSLSPTSVNIQTIVLGNILAITPTDTLQLVTIGVVSLVILLVKWKDLMVTFFDESHARSIGLNPTALKILFFTLLAASTVAALQTVGAFLVICMVITPGATAYLLSDRFPRLLIIAVTIGTLTNFFGAYVSYFLDGATGGVIVVLQTAIFLIAFVFAPKHGMLAARRRAAASLAREPAPAPREPMPSTRSSATDSTEPHR
ncbi:metal ABC transporter permease [Salinicola sp. V024]|uniref:metal ABC transporter permease n=1 Tax=Salinicola sp. V024 TaxID=3459609 RepID=UPI004044A4E3